MNMVKNIALTLIAAATLYGGLTNPPAPVTAEDDYVPIEQVVRQSDGQLTYNDENATIDVTAKGVSYSLLLSEGKISINGAQCPGAFYTEEGTTYMKMGQAFELLDSPNPC